MSREFSFDSFPYETLHYSILEKVDCDVDEYVFIKENLENEFPIKLALIPDVNIDAVYSLFYESKQCKLVCALYGPIPKQRFSLLPEKSYSNRSNLSYSIKYSPYAYKREWMDHKESQTDAILSQQLGNTMDAVVLPDELLNSVQWNVDIRILSHDGEKLSFFDGSNLGYGSSILSACINCTSIVLTMAGIPTKGIVSSGSILYVEHKDQNNFPSQVVTNPSASTIKKLITKAYTRDEQSSITNLTYGHGAFITYGNERDRVINGFTLVGKADYKTIVKHLLDVTFKIYMFQKSFIEEALIKNSTDVNQWL